MENTENKAQLTGAELTQLLSKNLVKRSTGAIVLTFISLAFILLGGILILIGRAIGASEGYTIVVVSIEFYLYGLLFFLIGWSRCAKRMWNLCRNKGFIVATYACCLIPTFIFVLYFVDLMKYKQMQSDYMPYSNFLMDAYICIMLLCTVAFATLVIIKSIKASQTDANEFYLTEAAVVYGKEEFTFFMKELSVAIKNKNYDKANELLFEAHDKHEKTPYIFLPSEWEKIYDDTVHSALVNGGEAEKTRVSEELKILYSRKNYEKIHELRCKYPPTTATAVTDGTTQAVAYGDGKFDGKMIQLLGLNILSVIVTVITIGIAFPATLCWKEKWLKSHTIIDGVRLSFDGKGSQLFGNWIKWMLLTLITVGIYAMWIPLKLENWKAKHTHFQR